MREDPFNFIEYSSRDAFYARRLLTRSLRFLKFFVYHMLHFLFGPLALPVLILLEGKM